MKLIVTGGAGFIGSHFVRFWLGKHPADQITTLDKLTYAGNLENLGDVMKSPRHRFVRGDIGHAPTLKRLLPGADAVVNFAAETHVDRSLLDANPFLQTNVQGTYTLVNAAREAGVSRFVHVSTDEVYGSVEKGKSREDAPLDPTSPYAASKAASDLVVRSQWSLYPRLSGFDHPVHKQLRAPSASRKIFAALHHQCPGRHPASLLRARFEYPQLDPRSGPLRSLGAGVEAGPAGPDHNIAGDREYKNIDVARLILKELKRPADLLNFVKDRTGHDVRYAPDARKTQRELGWRPQRPFAQGLVDMVAWYRSNESWWRSIKAKKGGFQTYYKKQYGARLSK